MARPNVILIGGAPGVGKTTLGRALAARMDATSLSADDLLTAAKALTTPESHRGLHVMAARDSTEYFTMSSVEELIADATVQHESLWPAIEQVVRTHAAWGPPIVIDGWFLQPTMVARLKLDRVISFWLVSEPPILEERERKNVAFFGRSHDPERMLQNFLGRSRWHNELIRRQATELGLAVLEQPGETSVDALCAMAMMRM